MNGTPSVAGWASSSANAWTPMWPSPIFWCRSRNAPRTSIESLAWTSRSRPGRRSPPPGRGWRPRRRARRAVRRRRTRGRCPGRSRPWGGSPAPRGRARGRPRPRTATGPDRRSARAAARERRRRPPRPAAAAGLADLPHRGGVLLLAPVGVHERAGVHDDALDPDLGGAAQVVGDDATELPQVVGRRASRGSRGTACG